jgi:hypothetical protein
MKKNDYQTPEMEVVKLNKKSTLLLSSTCPTQCDTEAGGEGSCIVD